MNKEDFKLRIREAERLLEYFVNRYAGKFKQAPLYNAYQDKLRLLDVLTHIGYGQARDAMDYMFKVRHKPTLGWFLYNYDELVRELELRRQDDAEIAKLKARTRELVERRRRSVED